MISTPVCPKPEEKQETPKDQKVTPFNTMIGLKTLVKEICQSPKKVHNFNAVCSRYNINRRAFYDFISIGAVFNICSRKTNESFEWFGLKRAKKVLDSIALSLLKDGRNKDIKTYFNCSLDSSIQNVAINVVKLFYYLELKVLDLRQVAKLFSQGKTKYKTILRKLYTVSTCLELAEIISKTNKVAEIRFLYDFPKQDKVDPKNILTLLNTRNDKEIEEVRKIYNQFTLDKRFTCIDDLAQQTALASPHIINNSVELL